jgi:hypothetical protein
MTQGVWQRRAWRRRAHHGLNDEHDLEMDFAVSLRLE